MKRAALQRATALGAVALNVLAALAAPGAAAAEFKLVLLARADDPRLERARVERAAPGHPQGPAADAVQMALRDSARALEAAKAALALQIVEVADAEAARAAAAAAVSAGAAALLADLPAAWLLAAADAVRIPVLNLGAAEDRLRGPDCRANLWHTLPSDRMRADALAQALVARRWPRVLLLAGPSEADAERSASVRGALARYRLELVGSKPFKLSADPRERDLANPRLLTNPQTSGGPYDVVWVVDADGEFAQTLPYRTVLPRPVVGDAGLAALAWSPKFERFGAPQVSRRLLREAGRRMGAADWPAWIGGKAVAAAAVAAPAGTAAAFQRALAAVEVDGSKGVAMSFRPWDGQLRQPLLLADAQAVVDMAPGDGVLHPRNVLDTLGADAPEKLCKARP